MPRIRNDPILDLDSVVNQRIAQPHAISEQAATASAYPCAGARRADPPAADATNPLKEVDIKRARDALKNDPFVQHYKPWQDAIQQLLEMGVRAEQQAFAVHDLNYVIENYLPEKLASPKKFLP